MCVGVSPVNHGVCPGFRRVCDTVLTPYRRSLTLPTIETLGHASAEVGLRAARSEHIEPRQVPRSSESLKSGAMSAKAIAVSFAGGIVGHIVLALSYLAFKLTGSAAVMLTMDVACVLVPFLVAGVGSQLLGPQAVRPLAAI